jgi:hypothetical protein
VLQAQHREKEAEPSAWFEVDVTPGDCNCASVVLCHARDFHASPPPDGLVPRDKSDHASSNDCDLMTSDEPTPAMRNPEKDPAEWTTGEEPMTGPQRSYLQTLCREAGEEFNDKLTKAEASRKIEQLQTKTGRGKS